MEWFGRDGWEKKRRGRGTYLLVGGMMSGGELLVAWEVNDLAYSVQVTFNRENYCRSLFPGVSTPWTVLQAESIKLFSLFKIVCRISYPLPPLHHGLSHQFTFSPGGPPATIYMKSHIICHLNLSTCSISITPVPVFLELKSINSRFFRLWSQWPAFSDTLPDWHPHVLLVYTGSRPEDPAPTHNRPFHGVKLAESPSMSPQYPCRWSAVQQKKKITLMELVLWRLLDSSLTTQRLQTWPCIGCPN